MHNFVDIHSHTLPGVDDGLSTLKDTLQCFSMLKKLGFGTVFCTPHQKEGSINTPMESINTVFNVVKEENANKIALYRGIENFLDSQFLLRLQNNSIPTMGKSTYILFELNPLIKFPKFKDLVFRLTISGYTPILAHIERYEWINLKILKELSHSLTYQLNITSLLADYTSDSRHKRALKYFDAGIVDYVATDLHDISLIPKIEEGLDWIDSHAGRASLEKLLIKNPRKIIKNIKKLNGSGIGK